ncbi:MAG: class I SAM-dependent methyltransferase [Desulfobacterales bacterium]|nr:class I SAM-dependent methyltransferase [Desulfobacterales bacterium]
MKSFLDTLFVRGKHTCPWWLCFTFDNLLRKLFQNPEQILRPYVAEGITVLDIGPGMGYFSIPLARMVGPRGRVIAVDIQPEMLSALQKRAKRAAVDRQIVIHLCKADSLGLDVKADFALAFWMLHEVPNPISFFKEMRSVLRASGKLLVSEPAIHVTAKMYAKTIEMAISTGFKVIAEPKIFLSRSALLTVS